MPCAQEWHQPGMLDVVGPRAFGYDLDDMTAIALAGIAAVVGHNWSVYVRFTGGRGVNVVFEVRAWLPRAQQ